MRYAEFRDRRENSVLDAGLMIRSGFPSTETIDLGDSVRHWKARIIGITPPSANSFDVSADISFEWCPVDAARAHTCEEDLLTVLIGRGRRSATTQPRWARVDLFLRAHSTRQSRKVEIPNAQSTRRRGQRSADWFLIWRFTPRGKRV